MAQAMTTEEALKIVLELAEQNVLEESQIDWEDLPMQEEQQRQIRAVAIVRVAFRIT